MDRGQRSLLGLRPIARWLTTQMRKHPLVSSALVGIVGAWGLAVAVFFGPSGFLIALSSLLVFGYIVPVVHFHYRKATFLRRTKLETDASLREVSRQLAALEGLVSRVEGELGSQLAALEGSVSRVEGELGSQVGRSRSVRQVLNSQEMDLLVSSAAPGLGLDIDRNHLRYLANRVLNVEKNMRGRIASTVATQVLRNLCLLSQDKPELRVLEVGVLFGGATLCFWDVGYGRRRSVHFTLADFFDGYYDRGFDPLTGEVISEAVVTQNLHQSGLRAEDYQLVKGDSTDPSLVAELATQHYDLLLIDGDHSFEGVSQDYANFGGLVRPGGLILIDDYENPSWPGVTRFVDEELKHDSRLSLVFSGLETAVFRVK